MNKEKSNNFKNYSFSGRKSNFDIKLFYKYDIPAREVVNKYFGESVMDNPNPLAPDLLILDKDSNYKYLELQVCTKWVNKFPYDNVYIFERKVKYGLDCLFLVLNRSMTEGYVFDIRSLQFQKPRRIKKYSRDFVFDIPWKSCIKISLENDLADDILKYYS